MAGSTFLPDEAPARYQLRAEVKADGGVASATELDWQAVIWKVLRLYPDAFEAVRLGLIEQQRQAERGG